MKHDVRVGDEVLVRLTVRDLDVDRFQAEGSPRWFEYSLISKNLGPALPAEPPDGTILLGQDDREVFMRLDEAASRAVKSWSSGLRWYDVVRKIWRPWESVLTYGPLRELTISGQVYDRRRRDA